MTLLAKFIETCGEILKGRKEMIDVEKLDPKFKYEVMKEPGGEHLTMCFACGTCSASCPIREVDERFNPRRIIKMAILGMKKEVLSSDFIWLCTSCYACHERCPQGVLVTDLMTALKNLAVKEGYMHPSYEAQIAALHNYGGLYEIEDFTNKKRVKRGLPPISQNAESARKLLNLANIYKYVEKEEELRRSK